MRRWNAGLTALLGMTAIIGGIIGCTPTNKQGAAGGGTGNANKIVIEGSNTVQPIAQAWLDEFKKTHAGVNVSLSGAGTGVGIQSLIDGTADICNASRAMKEDEIAKAKQEGFEPKATQIAVDGIAIAVNEKNTVPQLTLAQLKDMYQGRITDWKEVGGTPGKIVLFSRESTSGTYDYFKDEVLKKEDFAQTILPQPNTEAEVAELKVNQNAIAYGGLAYFENKPGIKLVPLVNDKGQAVAPTTETITSGEYPLARPLFMYTKGEPTGHAKEFIDFGLSPQGQELVAKAGYIPLKK